MTSAGAPSELGVQLVTEELGVSPDQLLASHCHHPTSPHGLFAVLIQQAVWTVDSIQNALVRKAGHAREDLLHIVNGTDRSAHTSNNGYLQHTSVQIEILASRRGDAITHLQALLAAYEALNPADSAAPGRPTALNPTAAQTTSTADNPAASRSTSTSRSR
jgi:hypothetical protein